MRASDLSDAYVLCRTVGHSWDDNPSAAIPHSEQWRTAKAALFLRCTRCRTERFDYFGNGFEVEYRYYRYPDGYSGLQQGTRPVLRGEMFRRSLLLRKPLRGAKKQQAA
jgi:hypothetical protein